MVTTYSWSFQFNTFWNLKHWTAQNGQSSSLYLDLLQLYHILCMLCHIKGFGILPACRSQQHMHSATDENDTTLNSSVCCVCYLIRGRSAGEQWTGMGAMCPSIYTIPKPFMCRSIRIRRAGRGNWINSSQSNCHCCRLFFLFFAWLSVADICNGLFSALLAIYGLTAF